MHKTTINILVFGQLEDITGASSISVPCATDTAMLLEYLYNRFPALKQQEFRVAVDQKIIYTKTVISEQAQIALLPPFSGG